MATLADYKLIIKEAAARIEQLEAENKRLRAELEMKKTASVQENTILDEEFNYGSVADNDEFNIRQTPRKLFENVFGN